MSPAKLTLSQINPKVRKQSSGCAEVVRKVFAGRSFEKEGVKSSTSVIMSSLKEEAGIAGKAKFGGAGDTTETEPSGRRSGAAGNSLEQERLALQKYRDLVPKQRGRIDMAIEASVREETLGMRGQDLGKMQMLYGAKFASAPPETDGQPASPDIVDVTLNDIVETKISGAGQEGIAVLEGRIVEGIKILASDASLDSKKAAIDILNSTKKQTLLLLVDKKQEELLQLEKKHAVLENIQIATSAPQKSRVKAFERATGITSKTPAATVPSSSQTSAAQSLRPEPTTRPLRSESSTQTSRPEPTTHPLRSAPSAQSFHPEPAAPSLQPQKPLSRTGRGELAVELPASYKQRLIADISYQELAAAARSYVQCLDISQDCGQQEDWFLMILGEGARARIKAGEPQAALGEDILRKAVRLAGELQQASETGRAEVEISSGDLERCVDIFPEINGLLAEWMNIDGKLGTMNEAERGERHQEVVNKLAYLHLSQLPLEEINALIKMSSWFIERFAGRQTGREKSVFIEALSAVGLVKANKRINRIMAGSSSEGLSFHNYCQGAPPLEELQQSFLHHFGRLREQLVVQEESVDQDTMLRELFSRDRTASLAGLEGDEPRLRSRRLLPTLTVGNERGEEPAPVRTQSEPLLAADPMERLQVTQGERAHSLEITRPLPEARVQPEAGPSSPNLTASVSEFPQGGLEPEVIVLPPPQEDSQSEQSSLSLAVSDAQLQATRTATDNQVSSDERIQAVSEAGLIGASSAVVFRSDLPRADFAFNVGNIKLVSTMGQGIYVQLEDGPKEEICSEAKKGGSGEQFGKGFAVVQRFLVSGIEKTAPNRYSLEEKTRIANSITSISNQSMMSFFLIVGLQSQTEIERSGFMPYSKMLQGKAGASGGSQHTSYEVFLTPGGCRITGRCRVKAAMMVGHLPKGLDKTVSLDKNQSYYEANVFVETNYNDLLHGPRSDGQTKVWHTYEGKIVPAPEE